MCVLHGLWIHVELTLFHELASRPELVFQALLQELGVPSCLGGSRTCPIVLGVRCMGFGV